MTRWHEGVTGHMI